MQRRVFIELCGTTVVVAITGCIDEPGATMLPTSSTPLPPTPLERRDGVPPMGRPDAAMHPDARDHADADPAPDAEPTEDAAPPEADAEVPPEDAACPTAEVHDTYAQALYYDGTYGPLTGTILAREIADGVEITYEFWHGHGGMQHMFTVTPADFEQLKRGERVTIETSEVESHSHTLFIDPVDPDYRVDGGETALAPVCD